MWEGLIQWATWDVVKLAASSAMAKLCEAGIAPPASHESTTSLRAGWRQYQKSGRKQYEMFLSLKRTVKTLPDGHAEAYARAKDQLEFGKMVRKELAEKDCRLNLERNRLASPQRRTFEGSPEGLVLQVPALPFNLKHSPCNGMRQKRPKLSKR